MCPNILLSTVNVETWVQSLGWEDRLEKELATHSCILPEHFMNRGAWQAAVPGLRDSDWVTQQSMHAELSWVRARGLGLWIPERCGHGPGGSLDWDNSRRRLTAGNTLRSWGDKSSFPKEDLSSISQHPHNYRCLDLAYVKMGEESSGGKKMLRILKHSKNILWGKPFS